MSSHHTPEGPGDPRWRAGQPTLTWAAAGGRDGLWLEWTSLFAWRVRDDLPRVRRGRRHERSHNG
jgi:hypothetical protein